MTRSEIHSQFVERFSRPRKKFVAVAGSDISAVEKEVGTVFPVSFVAFITSHGPVSTPNILDLVVDAHESGESDFEGWDVAEFFTPAEIPKTHAMYAGAGMDASVIPFARDSSGNLFGFQRITTGARPDDAVVMFFDHDYCEVSTEADSFDHWLGRFLQLRPS